MTKRLGFVGLRALIALFILSMTTGMTSVHAQEEPVEVPLQQQWAQVTVNVSSANPELADTLPVGTTWSITSVENPALTIGGVLDEPVTLPRSGTLDLPVPMGDYVVQINGAPAFEPYVATFTVDEAQEAFDVVLIPLAPEPTTGSVTVAKYYCDDVANVIFDGEVGEECVFGPATFTFYLVGDNAAVYQQLIVDETGNGTIELAAGQYEVVEEGTQARVTINVAAGEVTRLVVQNPVVIAAPVPGETPVTPDTPVTPAPPDVPVIPVPTETVSATETPDESANPVGKASDDTPVTTLPSTGQGGPGGTAGMPLMLSAAVSIIAAAGAVAIRHKPA